MLDHLTYLTGTHADEALHKTAVRELSPALTPLLNLFLSWVAFFQKMSHLSHPKKCRDSARNGTFPKPPAGN